MADPRITLYGKEGCYLTILNNQPQFVSSEAASGFKSLPLDQLYESGPRIVQLKSMLERKQQEIESVGRRAIAKFSEYLNTNVPVCKAPTIDPRENGLLFAFSSLVSGATGSASKDYQACLNKRLDLQKTIDEGNREFVKMVELRTDFYADYNEVLKYAPTQNDWTTLCGKKLNADRRFKDLSKDVSDLATKALKKLQKENEAQSAETAKIDTTVNFLEAFLNAIREMIVAIAQIFKNIIEGVSIFTKTLAKYPWLLWAAGATVGISVLAFVFRPYISLAATALTK